MPQRAPKRPRMRPRFDIALSADEGDLLLAELALSLRAPDLTVRGRVLPKHAELTTCERLTHVWSPRLTLHVESEDGGADSLCGRFSPHPNVWTGFLTLYATLGLGGVFAAIFGVSQSTLGMPAWGFLGVPVALALAAFTYGAAFIGQGLGAEEMYVLRSFVDEALRRVRDERARAAEVGVPEHTNERVVLPKTA